MIYLFASSFIPFYTTTAFQVPSGGSHALLRACRCRQPATIVKFSLGPWPCPSSAS